MTEARPRLGRLMRRHGRSYRVLLRCLALALGAPSCSASPSPANACQPPDGDGVVDLNATVLVSISDTAFSVGGLDSGSTEPNIAVQNLSKVTLTVTNVGHRPHDLAIGCIPTHLGAGCPAQSCFPASAQIGTLQPGASVTTSFETPAVEGPYPFVSNEPGDTTTSEDAGVTGLVGEFVLQ